MNLELCQASEIEIFAKIINDWQPLFFFVKTVILHIFQCFNYTSVV